jgi:sn-glycerol 3-phosphate transport system substrate-binding protein
VSKKLKAAGYDCPMAINYDTWPILEQFSAIHGQPVATKSNGYAGLDGELVFNKTKFVDYVTFLKAGYDAGIFKLKLPETGATNTQAFAAADCQMMMSSVADHGTVTRTQKAGMSWGVALLPVYEGTKRLNSLVGGASLWVLQGKTAPEYKGAAAFLAFIAKPESELFWSTRTGYIPVTKSGFAFLKGQGFYDNPTYKGRELALESLTASPVNPDLSRGIRLGGFIAIRKEVRDGLQDIFAGNVTVQKGIDGMVERGNVILRRFQQTYANKPLP